MPAARLEIRLANEGEGVAKRSEEAVCRFTFVGEDRSQTHGQISSSFCGRRLRALNVRLRSMLFSFVYSLDVPNFSATWLIANWTQPG
jgi:hypothetical protein